MKTGCGGGVGDVWEASSSVIYAYIYHKWNKRMNLRNVGIWKWGIFHPPKKRSEGGSVLPFSRATRGRHILYLDLLQMCIASTRRCFSPPATGGATEPRPAETLGFDCCRCQSHDWTENNMRFKKRKRKTLDEQWWIFWDRISCLSVAFLFLVCIYFLMHLLFCWLVS